MCVYSIYIYTVDLSDLLHPSKRPECGTPTPWVAVLTTVADHHPKNTTPPFFRWSRTWAAVGLCNRMPGKRGILDVVVKSK